MTADQIRDNIGATEMGSYVALREIAAQLAEMNERACFTEAMEGLLKHSPTCRHCETLERIREALNGR